MAGTQREAGAALGVVLEKGVFGLRTECFFAVREKLRE
jgi:hypothetical protein